MRTRRHSSSLFSTSNGPAASTSAPRIQANPATATRLPIRISVFDEDDTGAGGTYKDDEIDINPLPNNKKMEFIFSDLERQTPFFTYSGAKPDSNRATLTGLMSVVPLQRKSP